MKRNILFVVLSLLIIASCSNSREKDAKAIKDLEVTLKANSKGALDVVKSKELVDAYIKFAKDFPKDSSSANYLFKAATLSINIENPKLSVELFDQIMKDYPTYSKFADCMFLKAFVYDNNLKDIKKARIAYEAFLKKYPTHAWAKDVPGLIEMLGKTSEQISDELKEKQKSDSLTKK
jgi:TolA-binding protein